MTPTTATSLLSTRLSVLANGRKNGTNLLYLRKNIATYLCRSIDHVDDLGSATSCHEEIERNHAAHTSTEIHANVTTPWTVPHLLSPPKPLKVSATLRSLRYFHMATTLEGNPAHHSQSYRLYSQGRRTDGDRMEDLPLSSPGSEETMGLDGRREQMKQAANNGREVVSKGATSLRDLVRKYGFTFVGTYFSVWVLTLSTLFGVLDSGLVDPVTLSNIHLPWHSETGVEEAAAEAKEIKSSVDMITEYMQKYEWTKSYASKVEENPRITNLAIAFVATKLTEPIRIAVTVGIVPRLSKILRPDQFPDTSNIKKE